MLKTIARLATGLVLVNAGLMQAQATADTRWSAWLGCWRTADAESTTTCVVPTARPSAVDVVTIINGAIDSRQRIDADSQPHPIDRAGCRGTETASWSPTDHRVYRRADLVCPGGVNGTSTTLMAISPSGEWLNIEGVRAGAGSLERLDRFHDVGLPSTIPKEIRTAIARRQLAITTARAAAAAPITEADVLEANANVDPGVVRSWLAEAGAGAAVAGLASPVRQAQPMAQELATPAVENAPNCMPANCYAPNPYSAYNGYGMYPYGAYSPFYSPWGFGFGGPVIIVRGTNRPPIRAGHEPPRHNPPRAAPTSPLRPQPPRHEPPRHIPSSRVRP